MDSDKFLIKRIDKPICCGMAMQITHFPIDKTIPFKCFVCNKCKEVNP